MSRKRIRASDTNEGFSPSGNCMTHEYASANCFSDLNNRSQYKNFTRDLLAYDAMPLPMSRQARSEGARGALALPQLGKIPKILSK